MGVSGTHWATVPVGKEIVTSLDDPTMVTTTMEEYERIACDHFDRVWNTGEFDSAVLADGYRVVGHIGEHAEMTRKEFRGKVNHFQEAFPDLKKEPIDTIASDDAVVIPYRFTGTHEHELMGIPATGNQVDIAAVDVVYIDDALIQQEWYVADFLRMMRQLGVTD